MLRGEHGADAMKKPGKAIVEGFLCFKANAIEVAEVELETVQIELPQGFESRAGKFGPRRSSR